MAGSNSGTYGTTFVAEFEYALSTPDALNDVATNSYVPGERFSTTYVEILALLIVTEFG